MNRLRTISLIAALCALALVATGCGKDKASSESLANTANPKQTVVDALKGVATYKTGQIKLGGNVEIASAGKVGIDGQGPFDITDISNPEFDLTLSLGIAGSSQKVGISVVDGIVYFKVAGQAIEVGKAGDTGVAKMIGASDPTQLVKLFSQLEAYTTDVKAVGTGVVGGKPTTNFTAKVDFAGLLKEAAKNGDTGLAVPGLTGANNKEFANSMGASTITVGVDNATKLAVSLKIDAKFGAQGSGASGKAGGSGLAVSIEFTDVNEPVTIEKPANAIKGGGSMLKALGGAFGASGN
ncbi:MAG: hypothetical protein JHC87_03065 [Thermoleophilaceae bacterium]|nr:hypothetical protein [Thermoleophilaceae bacterium]